MPIQSKRRATLLAQPVVLDGGRERRILNPRPLSNADRRLLVVLPKGIGDVVYGLGLVEAILQAHPQIEITWVVQPVAAPLLLDHPAVHRVISYAPSGGLRALQRLRGEMQPLRFDVVLSLGMYLHALPPVLLAKSRRVVGLDRSYAKDGLAWLHREKVPAPPGAHVMDVFAEVGRYLGLDLSTPLFRLPLRGDESDLRLRFFAGAEGRPKVALVPCAGRPEKDWPVERYAELAGRLHSKASALVVVVGGPREAEAQAAARISAGCPEVRLAVGDDLRRVLWVLSGCDLIIAPDTGPIHMARALQRPVIGLYGHTDPRRYGPYPPFAGTLLDRYHFDAPGLPSPWQGTGGREDRMQRIAVSEVEEAALAWLLKSPVAESVTLKRDQP